MPDVPRSTPQPRRRGEKSLLSLDAILEAGLGVLAADGIEAVTMRRVADELHTGPASIYRWVSDRAALLELMLDRALDEIALPAADPAHWREQIHAVMDQTVAVLRRYPGIAQVGLANIPTSGAALRIREAMLASLLAGDVEEQAAGWAIDVLPLLALATALETELYTQRDIDLAAESRRITRAYTALPAEQFPTITAHLEAVLGGTRDQRFTVAIDTYLDGLTIGRHKAHGENHPTSSIELR